jgi:hypothetical protein
VYGTMPSTAPRQRTRGARCERRHLEFIAVVPGRSTADSVSDHPLRCDAAGREVDTGTIRTSLGGNGVPRKSVRRLPRPRFELVLRIAAADAAGLRGGTDPGAQDRAIPSQVRLQTKLIQNLVQLGPRSRCANFVRALASDPAGQTVDTGMLLHVGRAVFPQLFADLVVV